MQAFPGGIWSSQDYYQNDAGILLSETTINQSPFDMTGEPLTTRARKAIQYSESIDEVVKHLAAKNNGLYTNEWLIGDAKTNEVAMFELGTKKSKLWRSSKDEWFGGTKGLYWGCNNAKDAEVRLEARPASGDRPEDGEWQPHGRDKAWLRWFEKYDGKIDAAAAKAAFGAPPLAGPHSLDAKFTTTALAKDLAAHALYGPPTGRVWEPSVQDRHVILRLVKFRALGMPVTVFKGLVMGLFGSLARKEPWVTVEEDHVRPKPSAMLFITDSAARRICVR